MIYGFADDTMFFYNFSTPPPQFLVAYAVLHMAELVPEISIQVDVL